MREYYLTRRMRVILACVVASVVSGGFYFSGLSAFNTGPHWYLFWNLGLAWIPLGVALVLERILRTKLWSSWPALVATGIWLAFFPNAFYLITDLYHLVEFNTEDLMHASAMFFMFVLTGVITGFLSLSIIHKELLKRVSARAAWGIVGGVMLLTGFAIHLGRDLRWNSWDMLTRPASLLFDISERLLHPMAHPQTFVTTATFFTLFSTVYYILWQFARSVPPPNEGLDKET